MDSNGRIFRRPIRRLMDNPRARGYVREHSSPWCVTAALVTDPLRQQFQPSLGAAYILERELGGGGMSRVFVARDQALGRDVVVKVLAPELAAGLSAERFTREIKLAAALQEPHIVPVHAAGATADGLPWYTMPLVDGEDLRARIAAWPCAAVRSREHPARRRACAGVCARPRHRASRHQAGERAAVVGHRGRHRLRHREGPLGGADGAGGCDADAAGHVARHAGVHGAGAGRGRRRRRPRRSLRVGRHRLRAARGASSVRGQDDGAAADRGAHRGDAAPLGSVARSVPPSLAALVMRTLAKEPAKRPASAAELVAALDGVGGMPRGDVTRD